MKHTKKSSLSRMLFLITAMAILVMSLMSILVSLTLLYSTFLDESQENLAAEADFVAAGVELE